MIMDYDLRVIYLGVMADVFRLSISKHEKDPRNPSLRHLDRSPESHFITCRSAGADGGADHGFRIKRKETI